MVSAAHERTIWLTADLIAPSAEWNLTCSGLYEADFEGPFTTSTEPAAYLAIADRLKLLADRLPVIVELLA